MREEERRREEEERQRVAQRERERKEKEEQERAMRDEMERLEREKRERASARSTSGVRGVRGTRASIRAGAAARGVSRTGAPFLKLNYVFFFPVLLLRDRTETNNLLWQVLFHPVVRGVIRKHPRRRVLQKLLDHPRPRWLYPRLEALPGASRSDPDGNADLRYTPNFCIVQHFYCTV